MIGTLDIKVNAAHPNMPLSPVYTFLGSPQQVRVINVPKAIGNWKITAVQVSVNYPDNSSPSVEATLVGGCWSATLPAPSAVGQSLMGFKVTASGTDEHGDAITGYVLGKGDAYVLDDDATITVGGTTYYVHILDDVPESPRKGDLAVIDNIYQLYDGSRWHPLGNQATISWSDITGKPDTYPPSAHKHTKSEITDFPTEMPPTAHSHANDGWFTTAIEDVKLWAKSLLPDWLTPSREEPPTQDFVLSVEYKANNARDAAQLAENKAEDALVHADEALAGLDGKANSSDIPSLSGQTFDISVDAQFKNMCISTARALGAVVTHTTDDTSTGGQVAQAYGITPTDATTFGELQTKAGLGDSAVIGDL